MKSGKLLGTTRRISMAYMDNYYENVFLDFGIEVNENGIVIDFRELYARENRWAVGPDHLQLRDEIHVALGFEGEHWLDVTSEQADEEEAMYWSARHGEAQLRYDEIMERHRADWAKYY
jgi:hypothetical protein